ncbi:glycoside hydrolase family 172 protein [Oleiagrimonas sp. C23AA]|uniref:glycoside hydrolase family 172 protein n=1 Tax=Oleiagrimonas sp. C23AA TaxID=2719047 RepID=UPI001422E179|nr:glycoside hydrolase family 172 protein [Oleiagrimonas sp. C23AA]NII09430.1 DUF2961 domain-containing protein [Oleiagrimonas sp. C23AA]
MTEQSLSTQCSSVLRWTLLVMATVFSTAVMAQSVYQLPPGVVSRMSSPENHNGVQGQGARLNQGAKGHAFDAIPAHGHVDLLNVDGPGIVKRIKLSTSDRSAKRWQQLRIVMTWDHADKPAVSVPLDAFFGLAFGAMKPYQSVWFTDAEGRSLTSTLPMPYRTGAHIAIYNDGDTPLTHIYYNVSYERWPHAPPHMAYLHAYWHRNTPPLGQDFVILPRVKGHGAYLGTNIGVRADPIYGAHWWGEGEVKMYIDGDRRYPSLVGTGVEDYFGTAWGMSHFINRDSGCVIANKKTLRWACYRYHAPDPVYFQHDLKVTVQQIGGGPLAEVREHAAHGAPMKLISVDANGHISNLLTMQHPPKLSDKDFPDGWVNYFRHDDWSAVAYFYLDTPTDNLARKHWQGSHAPTP